MGLQLTETARGAVSVVLVKVIRRGKNDVKIEKTSLIWSKFGKYEAN